MSSPRRKRIRRPNRNRRKAAAVLFLSGFSMRQVGGLLALGYGDVQRALRKTLVLFVLLLAGAGTAAAQITIPNTFVNQTPADATQVNANFAALGTNALNRAAGTMTGTLTSQAITPSVDTLYALGDATHRYTTGNFSGLVGTGQVGLIGGTGFSVSGAGLATVAYDNVKARLVASLNGGAFVDLGPGWTVVTSTSTGTLNNFAPGIAGHTILRMNNASLATITGLTAGFDGQHVLIVSVGAGEVDLPYQSGSSTANFTNLLRIASSMTPLKASLGMAEYIYSTATANWVMSRHDQGGAIDYSATSTVTGWASFSQKRIYYEVIGSRVYIDYDIEGPSNATTTSFTIPYIPTLVTVFTPAYAQDNTGTPVWGLGQQTSATMNFAPTTAGNMSGWTNSGTKVIVGQFNFQAN